MKAETQHLDFLISQYVDGSLDGPSRKSVEQKLLSDPEARTLYAEHREVQDLLDDYGNRIPMVNWGDFDKKLEARLEVEAREKQRVSAFRRRLRPVAAAAALLVAASLGYAWHAFAQESQDTAGKIAPRTLTPDVQSARVVWLDGQPVTRASQSGFRIEEPGVDGFNTGTVDGVAFGAPADQVALQALQTNVQYGLGNLLSSATPQPSGIVVGSSAATAPAGEADPFR